MLIAESAINKDNFFKLQAQRPVIYLLSFLSTASVPKTQKDQLTYHHHYY